MIFTKNQLFKINLLDNASTERILWIDSNYGNCITIDIEKENTKAKPEMKKLETLHQLFDDGILELVQKDPYRILFREEDLNESEINNRNSRWDLIQELVKLEPDIYLETTNSMIKRVFQDKKVSVSSVYRNLRLYWQRGMVKNALLPDFRVCGGKGKRKKLGDAKVGFRNKGEEAQGINVTEEVDYFFKKGLEKCKESGVTKIIDIYDFILREYFVEGYRYENGEMLIQLKKEEEIPTERQFRYWYEYNSGKTREQRNIDKYGKRKHNLNSRAVLGKSDTDIIAPGAQFQIDSTKSDIYIVSEIDPNVIIGKPTTYFVRDVFSRMVAGMYIGIKEASWVAARMAFVNTITDKVKFCAKYGITITEEQWPIHHFPESILADNGSEFKSYKMEILSDVFNINPINAPAYRADFKGIIEQLFRMLNDKVKPFAPGSTTGELRERGEKDPRLKARFTLSEYTQAMIRTVLYFNNSHWLDKYNPDRDMIKDNVKLVPLEMWNWGIKKRSGVLKFYEEDFVKFNLMDRFKEATVEKYGIHVKGGDLYYECEKARDEGWFKDAALKGSWNVELAYDPASTDQVYIVNKDGTYEICTLLPHCQHYGGMSFDDYNKIRSKRKNAHDDYLHTQKGAKLNLDYSLSNLRVLSEENYQNNKIDQSKSSIVNGIRENRQKERAINDYQER